jgi:hypothetical protein
VRFAIANPLFSSIHRLSFEGEFGPESGTVQINNLRLGRGINWLGRPLVLGYCRGSKGHLAGHANAFDRAVFRFLAAALKALRKIKNAHGRFAW